MTIMKKYKESLKTILDRLHLSIKKNNLKNSKQREYILKAIYEDGGHLSPEDIFVSIKKTCKNASISSIYRILSFLEKEGFVLTKAANAMKLLVDCTMTISFA